MESVKIREWIKDNIGYGYGYVSGTGSGYGHGSGSGSGSGSGDGDSDGDGSGYGSGDGSGYGHGYGSGSGYGSGYGSGDGDGDGYGDGDWYKGIGAINGHPVWLIDETATIITAICRNIAKGYIVNRDLTLTPCFIAKGQGRFAHGETAKKAVEALQDKIFEAMDPEEAIEAFMGNFEPKKKYPAKDYYTWHHRLTGSCEMGRKQFFRDGGYDLEHDTFTVDEFIRITENAYGGEIIRQLKEAWKRKWRNE